MTQQNWLERNEALKRLPTQLLCHACHPYRLPQPVTVLPTQVHRYQIPLRQENVEGTLQDPVASMSTKLASMVQDNFAALDPEELNHGITIMVTPPQETTTTSTPGKAKSASENTLYDVICCKVSVIPVVPFPSSEAQYLPDRNDKSISKRSSRQIMI